MRYKYMADCHSHSDCSFDSTAPMSAMCARAAQLGLDYYALTDHCECDQYDGAPEFGGRKYRDVVRRAWREMEECRAAFPQLRILRGIELGQPLQNLPAALDALEGRDYDVVIGSLHSIAGHEDFYHMGSRNYSNAEKDGFIRRYFAELLEMVEWGEFDTLAHIDYPLRYFSKPGEHPSFAAYAGEMTAVFARMVEKGIALEFNTSRILRAGCPVLPYREIFTRYRSAGGTLVTLGADAHAPETIASGIPEALDLLAELGFTTFAVFENRKPRALPIEPASVAERKS